MAAIEIQNKHSVNTGGSYICIDGPLVRLRSIRVILTEVANSVAKVKKKKIKKLNRLLISVN